MIARLQLVICTLCNAPPNSPSSVHVTSSSDEKLIFDVRKYAKRFDFDIMRQQVIRQPLQLHRIFNRVNEQHLVQSVIQRHTIRPDGL